MDEYKFVKKYLNKEENKNIDSINYKKILISLFNRTLISFLLVITTLCITKIKPEIKKDIEKYVYTNNISFSKINNFYEKTFGNIEIFNNKDTVSVFKEELNYNKKEPYKEGVKLTVDNNYLVPVLESGLVVYKGNKDNYGYTIIIQQINGIDIWYVGLKETNLKLYEYIEKGSLLGEIDNNTLYLYYQRNGEFIDYKDFI